MTFLKSGRLSKDLEFIRGISKKIDRKLAQSKSANINVEKLTAEELQDLSKIANLADFLLTKYEDKKEIKEIIEYFASIVRETTESIDLVDDEISELVLSTEDSINKIKDMQSNISEKYDFEKPPTETEVKTSQSSSNNLTKFATEINSQEYQQNSTDKDAQVI